MKNITILGLLSLFLLGCVTSTKIYEDKDEFVDVYPVTNIKYADHFVSCRSKKRAEVENVLVKARQSKGVILYFHGGLSSDRYMKKKLGPWLMGSIFLDKNIDGLYPIFVNYDAGVFDLKKIADFLRKKGVRIIINIVTNRLDMEVEKKGIVKEAGKDTYFQASREILSQSDKKKILTNEDYLQLLVDEKAQASKAGELVDLEPDLVKAARELEQLATEEGAKKGVIGGNPMKAIVRILARFATGTNHQKAPTIEEEVLRELKIYGVGPGEFAQHHWETVYKRSQTCWEQGRNGKYLIDGLKKIQQEKVANDESFTISTLSHSAGSIPVSFLVDYLSKTNDARLDNVVMIVPAINQKTFENKIIPNAGNIAKLKLFVLDLSAEERDKLAGGLYPASLLYFVSGLAEKKGFGDRMLLIQQHLDQERTPYNTESYQTMLKQVLNEEPAKLWNFFRERPGTVVFYDSGVAEHDHDDGGASHRCTKFPWATRDLAKIVLKIITDSTSDNFTLPRPDGAADC